MSMNLDTLGMLDLKAADTIGKMIAIMGSTGTGKSMTAAVLMEELLEAQIPICVVDFVGEYHTLKERYPKISIIGRSKDGRKVDLSVGHGTAAQIAEQAYKSGSSVVFDVSGVPRYERESLLQTYFERIWELSGIHHVPMVIFLEEAHNWIPQGKKTACKDLFAAIAAEGRKWGLSLVMISQRSAKLDKDILTQADIAFLHRVIHPADMKVYVAMIPIREARATRERVYKLKKGEAMVLAGDQVLRVQIRHRYTAHGGATPTMADIPQSQLSLVELMNRASLKQEQEAAVREAAAEREAIQQATRDLAQQAIASMAPILEDALVEVNS